MNWHGVLRCVANSRERVGPHSFVCLLFSFQRPSPGSRSEYSDLGPSPCHRGVARTSVLVQEGAAYILQPLRTVKGQVREKVRTSSRPEEPDFYIGLLRPVKLPVGAKFASAVGFRRGATSTPSPGFPSSCFGKLISLHRRLRGALSLSPRRVPRQEGDSNLRTSLLRGARYVAPPRISVNVFASTS